MLRTRYPPDGVVLYVFCIEAGVELHNRFERPEHAVDSDEQQFELSV